MLAPTALAIAESAVFRYRQWALPGAMLVLDCSAMIWIASLHNVVTLLVLGRGWSFSSLLALAVLCR